MSKYSIQPDPEAEGLSTTVEGINETGESVSTNVVTERALTLYLNAQEVVTMMTIGDHPDLLAIGFLLNQNMLHADDVITDVDFDDDLGVVVVRTERETNYEDKMKKKVRTSGCAQGTTFGDLMESLEGFSFPEGSSLKTSWLGTLTKTINTTPSLYLTCLLYTSPSPRDQRGSRMPSSA